MYSDWQPGPSLSQHALLWAEAVTLKLNTFCEIKGTVQIICNDVTAVNRLIKSRVSAAAALDLISLLFLYKQEHETLQMFPLHTREGYSIWKGDRGHMRTWRQRILGYVRWRTAVVHPPKSGKEGAFRRAFVRCYWPLNAPSKDAAQNWDTDKASSALSDTWPISSSCHVPAPFSLLFKHISTFFIHNPNIHPVIQYKQHWTPVLFHIPATHLCNLYFMFELLFVLKLLVNSTLNTEFTKRTFSPLTVKDNPPHDVFKAGDKLFKHQRSSYTNTMTHGVLERTTPQTSRGSLTHHSDSVSDGFSRQVAAELGSDHPAAAVRSGHLSPDHSGLVGFTARRHCVPAHEWKHAFILQDSPDGWSHTAQWWSIIHYLHRTDCMIDMKCSLTQTRIPSWF